MNRSFRLRGWRLAPLAIVSALLLAGPARSQEAEDSHRRIEPTDSRSTGEAGYRLGTQETTVMGEAGEETLSEIPAGISDAWRGVVFEADYVIGPEDVLEIEVFNLPELKRTVRVTNDGMIMLPLVGHVRAAGFTTGELRAQLTERYEKEYLENPEISVFVTEFRARPVSVIGAVDKPGLYPLAAPRTLIEVLSMAGGLGKRGTGAAGRTLVVTRRSGFIDLQMSEGIRLLSPDKLEVEIDRLLYSDDQGGNIPIKPYDSISVSRADVVYVVGEVKKPGGFVLQDQEDVTVLQALAMAEGPNGTAKKSKSRIIRTSQDGSRTEFPIDLGKIMSGDAPDPVLAANDILFVPSSGVKSGVRRGVDAAIGTISGILVYRR